MTVRRALVATADWATGASVATTGTQTDDLSIAFGDADGIFVGGSRSECYHLKADCFYLKNSEKRSLRACSRCAVIRARQVEAAVGRASLSRPVTGLSTLHVSPAVLVAGVCEVAGRLRFILGRRRVAFTVLPSA